MRILRQLIVGAALCGLSGLAVAQEADLPTPVPDVAPSGAVVPATVSTAERITFLLSGYEYFPARADLDAVAPADEVTVVLRGLAVDVDARPTLRLRAVDALGYYADEASVALLKDLVETAPAADLPRRKLRTAGLLRHHAITSLAKALRGSATALLEPFLAAGDLQLALTAVDALAKHGGKEGRAALGRARTSSPHDLVRREAGRWAAPPPQ